MATQRMVAYDLRRHMFGRAIQSALPE